MTVESKMIRQTSFNLGEVDVSLYKRSNSEDYLSAAQSLKNCEITTTGLVKKRKGTVFVSNVSSEAQYNSRMFEFIDKNGEYYLVLMSNEVAYIYSAPGEIFNVVTHTGDNVINVDQLNVVVDVATISFLQALPVPYETPYLGDLDYTQDGDSIVFSHKVYAPGRIYVSDYSGQFPIFAFQYLSIFPSPAYDFGNVNYANSTVTVAVNVNMVDFTFVNNVASPDNFSNLWIGGQLIGLGINDTSPIGYGIIKAVQVTGTTTKFTVLPYVAFNTTAGQYYTVGSQYSIRKPVWNTPTAWPAVNPIRTGYPESVLYFQNRLWFGNSGSLNNTVFGSRIGQPVNFDVGTGRDTDAIIYTIGQTSSGPILWMNGGKQMEIYCTNMEFVCPQDQNAGLTPGTFSIRQQASDGTSGRLKPVTYQNDSYYVGTNGKSIIDFKFNGVGLAYVASNVSAHSQHLVKNPTNRALLRGTDSSQDNFIYFLNPSDDTLTAFQFANEVKLAALTPITFQENVELIDICTVGNIVYILKYYNLTNEYTIEALNPVVKVDGALTADMDVNGLVTGLSQYNGYLVQVIFQGQDFGEYTVSDGHIDVFNPDGYQGSVVIGLLYDVDIVPMYPFAGANASPLMKQVNRIYVDYVESLDFNINGIQVPYNNFFNIQNGQSLVPMTDTAIVGPFSGWNRFDTNINGIPAPVISITQRAPFDLQVTSIGYQITVAVL